MATSPAPTPERGTSLTDLDGQMSSSEVEADSSLLASWLRKCQAVEALWQGEPDDLKTADTDTVYKGVAQKIALAAQLPRSESTSLGAGLGLLVATLRNDHTAISTLVSQEDMWNHNESLAHVALFVAVEKGFPEAVSAILSGGVGVTSRDTEGLTCLHVACERNNSKMVELLVSREANVNARSNNGHTPFSQICGSRDHEAVAGILIASGAQKNVMLPDGTNALYSSAAGGKTDRVRTMLRHGMDPSFKTPFNWSPLHWAANDGHLDVVKLLLEAGADINCISDTVQTPLDLVNGKLGTQYMDQMRSYLVQNGGLTAQRILHSRNDDGADIVNSPSSTSPQPVAPLYQPLHADKREIRLLLIEEPGLSADIPSCLLQTFSIDAAPPYYALSYTWGDPNITGPVLINKKEVSHTVNAIAAIKALREMLPLDTVPNVHHVWIDAICIDQSNIAEKSSQISLMGEIYSMAERVLVWLGEDSDNSSQAMELLVQLGYLHQLIPLVGALASAVGSEEGSLSTAREDGLVLKFEIGKDAEPGFPGVELSFNPRPGVAGMGIALANQLGDKGFTSPADVLSKSWLHGSVKPRWDAMERLFSRPYWSRAWILQEIGLASSNPSPLLICGKRAVTWDTFRNAVEQLLKLMTERDLNAEQDPELSEVNLGSWIRQNVLEQLEPIRWILDRPEERPDYDMLDLVCLTSRSATTNPRDKIYALLGLVSPGKRSSIVPDYGLSVGRIYTDFVLAEVQRSWSLDILCLEHQFATDKEVPGLPSWVPDLTRQMTHYPPTIMRSSPQLKERARASDGEPHVWRAPENEGDLTVRGIRCCTVRSATAPQTLWRGGHEITNIWLEFARSTLPPELPGGLPLSQLFFRTLIRDMSGTGPPGHEMSPEDSRRLRRLAYAWITSYYMTHQVRSDDEEPRKRLMEEFEQILRHQHDHDSSEDRGNINECWGFEEEGDVGQQTASEVLSLMGTVLPAQHQFSLFTTAQGYLGLGPRYVREGDLLVVLAGMRVPAVLRPMSDHYIFLGDCYVYDLMQGQAVRAAREEGRGFEEFILR